MSDGFSLDRAEGEIFVCSNKACDAVYTRNPAPLVGHCPKCRQPSGVGYSCITRRIADELLPSADQSTGSVAERFIALLQNSSGVQGVHIDHEDCGILAAALQAQYKESK